MSARKKSIQKQYFEAWINFLRADMTRKNTFEWDTSLLFTYLDNSMAYNHIANHKYPPWLHFGN